MPGILPETSNGAVVIRDGTTCTNPSSVINAYCPGPDFNTTCNLTALPSDCTARITPAQINAIVSEMISFAECLDPDGTWTCGALDNLCTAFNAWWAENDPTADQETIGGEGTPASPFALIPAGAVNAICNDDAAGDALAACLIDGTAGNLLTQGGEGRLFVDGDALLADVCGDPAARAGLATCLLDEDVDNSLILGPNGGLFYDPCAEAEDIAACTLSADAGNGIILGTDNLHYAVPHNTVRAGTAEDPPDCFDLSVAGDQGIVQQIQYNVVNPNATLPLVGTTNTAVSGILDLRGNGNVVLTTEVSNDGGVTFGQVQTNQWRREGHAITDRDVRSGHLGQVIGPVDVPAGAATLIVVRTSLNVLTPYEAGAQYCPSLSSNALASTNAP